MTTRYGDRGTPAERVGEHLNRVIQTLLPQVIRVTAPGLLGGNPVDQVQRELDAVLCLHVLRAALRVADMAREFDPDRIDEAIARFNDKAPDVVRLRNVFEHFDEYETSEPSVSDKAWKRQVNQALLDAVTFFECTIDEAAGTFVIHVADVTVDVISASVAANIMLGQVQQVLNDHLRNAS